MGKGDTLLKVWLGDKKRFADLYNGSVFQGRQIVDAEKLEPAQKETKEFLNDKKGKVENIERHRDIVMKWTEGMELVILACESQQNIHYAMPIRTMLYDALNYVTQIRQLGEDSGFKNSDEFLSKMKKEDRLCPVSTLVFYYGEKDWDGSKDLYGLLKESSNPEIKEILRKLIPNYHINLVDVNKLEDTSVYKTDLQVILEMLKYRKDKKKMQSYVQEKSEYFQHIDIDTYNVLRVLLKAEKQLEDIKGKNKEEVNMCEALQGIFDDGVEQGMLLAKQIFRLWNDGKSEKEIADKCGITVQDVKRILE